MKEKARVITNNSMVVQQMGGKFFIEFIDGGLMDVLKAVRDYIHKGHKLLTHPLMGSVKPNETPFKTVLISMVNGETIDMDSLNLIENSIQTAEKFIRIKKTPNWTEKILEDFRLIDFDLIYHAIE